MSDDAHVSVTAWPVVKVYRGWGINLKRGLEIEGSVCLFFTLIQRASDRFV